jgi:hypothetical protein
MAAPTSVGEACALHMDSLEREAQDGARRYVSRHQMSFAAWSSPTPRPSAEAEFIPSTSVLSPHKPWCSGLTQALCSVAKISATADQECYAAFSDRQGI